MLQLTPGLYGKVPAHGDFIDRQLAIGFIQRWDQWLQPLITSSRERLGEQWLDLYLTSPIWRFMLSPGTLNKESLNKETLDEQSWAGILVPSVDSVGRYFPLTIASALPADTGLMVFCQQNESWFQALEATALAALQDGLNADQISAQLQQAPQPLASPRSSADSGNVTVQSADIAAALAAQLDSQVARNHDSYSVWLSVYTEPPLQNLLLARDMPSVDQYTAMLDNQWQQRG